MTHANTSPLSDLLRNRRSVRDFLPDPIPGELLDAVLEDATCAQGPLATWAGPVRAAFDIAPPWQLVCGVSIGFASPHAVNQFNPGRAEAATLRLPAR